MNEWKGVLRSFNEMLGHTGKEISEGMKRKITVLLDIR